MKKRLLIAFLLLAIILCGCAVNSLDETAVQTTVPTTQATTPPTEVATEPATEPTYPNYFDENEITIWENCKPEIRNFSLENQIMFNHPRYSGVSGYYSQYKMLYPKSIYCFPEDRTAFFSDSVNTALDVTLYEIPSDTFLFEMDSTLNKWFVHNLFDPYQEQIEPDITLEEWAEKFQDYKIFFSGITNILHSENLLTKSRKNNVDNWFFYLSSPIIIDKNSSTVLEPFGPKGSLRSFTVTHNGEEVECWAVYTGYTREIDEHHESLGSYDKFEKKRISVYHQFTILVPADYDGIIMGVCEIEDTLYSEEELYAKLDEPEEEGDAASDWWQGSMYEYLEGLENYRTLYFGMPPQK